jgi:hypothetical protein
MPLVVVIEDDPASQKTLARVLRAGGYEALLSTAVASDWTAAFSAASLTNTAR